MSADTSTRSHPDVKFAAVGTGLTISRACGARKGQWLCGTRISFKGICEGCKKAKAERKARAA